MLLFILLKMKINLFQCYICSKIAETFHKGALGYKHVWKACHEKTPDHVPSFTQMYKYCISYRNDLNYEKFLEDIQLLWEKPKKPSNYSFPDFVVKYSMKLFFTILTSCSIITCTKVIYFIFAG
jgi:hypothetical protein